MAGGPPSNYDDEIRSAMGSGTNTPVPAVHVHLHQAPIPQHTADQPKSPFGKRPSPKHGKAVPKKKLSGDEQTAAASFDGAS